jgi:hypothetical protein
MVRPIFQALDKQANLRKSCTWHIDLNNFDATTSWRTLTEYGCAHKEGSTVRAAEHNGKGLGLYLDSVGDLTAPENA